MALLFECAIMCDPEYRLDRVLPYFLSKTSDKSASIKILSLQYLLDVMSPELYEKFPDPQIFQDYILPSLSQMHLDSEELVRVHYARSLPVLATLSRNYLLRQDDKTIGNYFQLLFLIIL